MLSAHIIASDPQIALDGVLAYCQASSIEHPTIQCEREPHSHFTNEERAELLGDVEHAPGHHH